MNTPQVRSRAVPLAQLCALTGLLLGCGGGPGSDPSESYYLATGGISGAGGSSGRYMNLGTGSQSTTAFGGTANRGTDRNTSGDYWQGSVTHTEFETQPWWYVATQSDFPMVVTVYNRTDCCRDRLGRFRISFFSERHVKWFNLDPVDMAGRSFVDVPVPRDNDWGTVSGMLLTKLDPGYLSLAEVEVRAR